jgi:hypothetical protein
VQKVQVDRDTVPTTSAEKYRFEDLALFIGDQPTTNHQQPTGGSSTSAEKYSFEIPRFS